MSESQYAAALAEVLEEAGETDGVTLGPTDAALAAKALRALAAQAAVVSPPEVA
ncbi:hypothetical protein GGQ91_004864 [Methylobacterium fujisawaense]|uniref:Uncharacterized protein n=1 Tax=Methylobacterium fujisawaense TaxID=107400 RepID=A0ABR6DH75_9HYPH|nr:hypothetical protein [Methylobacterium fujisawaense]MBA9065447.1 hypothetical protein [Methylobacterium fujisawaense]